MYVNGAQGRAGKRPEDRSVELTAGGLVVRDLSTNSTFVGGKRVMGAMKVPFGTPIQVGPFTVRFREKGDAGVVAGVLNRRNTLGPQAGKRSRGELVLDALDFADAADAVEMLRQLDAHAFRPFNMVICDNRASRREIASFSWRAT